MFTTKSLKVYYYALVADISYQSRRIGLKDQWAAVIAEDIVKSYQIDRTNRVMQAIEDQNIASEMHAYFRNIAKSIPEQLTYTDFREGICMSLRLGDD